MVRSALERATAGRSAAAACASPATSSSSSASTSSSSSIGKCHRSPPAGGAATPASPSMRAAAYPSCLTYVLIAEADPRCPRCDGSGKHPGIPPPDVAVLADSDCPARASPVTRRLRRAVRGAPVGGRRRPCPLPPPELACSAAYRAVRCPGRRERGGSGKKRGVRLTRGAHVGPTILKIFFVCS
nr:trinucleotide repeat-containing gene 18 protein [Oryza sativa Japonica Group]